MGKILVIGSSNTDLIAKVDHFPIAGETIEGLDYFQAMGGKGANQAIAAHRLGGEVKFITCLGKDANGQNALKYYEEQGLDVSSSLIVDNVPSGTAMIWVNKHGENCIVITPGSNNMLTVRHVHEVKKDIKLAGIVVLQMEIPYETVKAVSKIAKKYGVKVLLNAAPARKLDAGLLNNVDILVVNETEAETVSGKSIKKAGQEAMMDLLLAMGTGTVILTLGKKGCLLKNKNLFLSVPAFDVQAVDSTAAGDTFCGAIAASISKGHDWEIALKFATGAAAICVMEMGAQQSIPVLKEVTGFLKNYTAWKE